MELVNLKLLVGFVVFDKPQINGLKFMSARKWQQQLYRI